MFFQIDPAILEKHPGLQIGVVVARGLDNRTPSPAPHALLAEQCEILKNDLSPERLETLPEFVSWREAYDGFGAKSKKYKCSVENLCRLVLERGPLRSINKLVDLYNYISLKYMVPVGGDDTDHVTGGIRLTQAQGNERFTALGGGESAEPKAGEVVYRDDTDILCRRWNWRECDKSKMTGDTRNAALVIEALPPAGEAQIGKAAAELCALIQEHCGGTAEWVLVNRDAPRIDIGAMGYGQQRQKTAAN